MFQSLFALILASQLSTASIPAQTLDDRQFLSVAPLPIQDLAFEEPSTLTGQSILSVDEATQSILYEKNAFERRSIASLTKLMTAYIILKENAPSDLVTVSQTAAQAQGSRMGLSSGEKLSVKDLLYGLLIESGNDAATALAEYNAGSADAFTQKMNDEAKHLGLEDTYYANTTGLDTGKAFSTARDLLVLSHYLLRDDSIREIVRQKEVTLTSQTGQVHTLKSTNKILGEHGVKGLKTGTTEDAGECLITLADSKNGHEILTVVLGSTDRFNDTLKLLDWIEAAFKW